MKNGIVFKGFLKFSPYKCNTALVCLKAFLLNPVEQKRLFLNQPTFEGAFEDGLTQARGALNAVLTPTLAGAASLTLTDSKISLLQQGGFYLPRQELLLGLTWVSPLRWRVAFDTQWRSQSRTFADVAPRSPYWSGNLSAYWETQDKRYNVAVFAKDFFSPHVSTFYGLAASVRF